MTAQQISEDACSHPTMYQIETPDDVISTSIEVLTITEQEAKKQ